MQREDGLFFRLDRNQRDLKKGKVASKKKVYIAKQNQDDVQGLIEEDDRKRPRTKMNKADEADGAPGEEFKQEQQDDNANDKQTKRKAAAIRRRLAKKKRYNDEYDDSENDDEIEEMEAY